MNEKQVKYLIAGACSSEYLAAAPIAQQKQVISFSGSATSPKISELGKYVFRTTPSDALAGKAAAAYARKGWEAKTAAVIWEDSEYPQALRSVFVEEFSRLGGTITVDESFDTGATDFSDIVAKLRKNPSDVIYILPQTPTPGILLVSAIQQAHVSSKLLTAEVLLIRDTVAKQGNLLEGVTGLELLFDEARPKTSAFFRGYKQEYGLDVTDPAYMAGFYDILYLIRQAHQAAADDPDTVSQRLYDTKDWEGALGKITFDSNGDPNLSFAIRTITNGEAKLVDQYTPESGE